MVELCKKGVIRFTWRHNLIYPIQVLIWTFFRYVDIVLLEKIFNFSTTFLFTLLMFLGQFFTSLILYFYQKSFLEKKAHKKSKKVLLYSKNEMKNPDSTIKLLLLIFFVSYFDFIQFLLYTVYIPKFQNFSGSLELRLGGILTILTAILCYYLLKFPIYKHQIFSIIIISICLFITIITEIFFQLANISQNFGKFGIKFLYIIFVHFFNTFFNITEKYILEYNYMHYFKVLILESVFGLLIILGYSFWDYSYITELIQIYSEYSGSKLALFILLLVIYMIVCGGRNSFRIITNKLYSPMAISLIDYFLNPIYFTYYYINGDFVSGEDQNLAYFLINFFLSIFISLCGCIYNEIFIVFLCGLESETHDQISYRSNINSNNFYDINQINADEEDNTEDAYTSELNTDKTSING